MIKLYPAEKNRLLDDNPELLEYLNIDPVYETDYNRYGFSEKKEIRKFFKDFPIAAKIVNADRELSSVYKKFLSVE